MPINHKFSAETIAFILDDAGVRYVFCDAARRGALPAGADHTDFDSADGDGFGAFLDAGDFEAVRPGDDEIAMVLYTSGSTGRPKGVSVGPRRTPLGAAHPPPAGAGRSCTSACWWPRRSIT